MRDKKRQMPLTQMQRHCYCRVDMTPMLPHVWIMVLLQVGLSLYVILKHASKEFKGPSKTIVSRFQTWAPWTGVATPTLTYRKLLGSHVVGWKYLVHLDIPTIIGWPIGWQLRVLRKLSAKEDHPSKCYFGLRQLITGVPTKSGLRPWV